MDINLEVYNKFPKELAHKFNKTGVRADNVLQAFSYFKNPREVSVLEIGCGNGRDTKEILKYSDKYIGIDYSEGMLEIAREYLPEAEFILADILHYEPTKRFDLIFSFASVVHMNKEELTLALKKLRSMLNENGIIYISTKYAPIYKEAIDEDEFGVRHFAYYDIDTFKSLALGYEVMYDNVKEVNNKKWLEIILKKV